MIQSLGHKYKLGERLGNKIRTIHRQGAKIVNNPIVRGVALTGAVVAGVVANKKIGEVKESRNERTRGERIMAVHRDTEHKREMERIDPGGVAKKRLDAFVETKPFESAFNFDEPF